MRRVPRPRVLRAGLEFGFSLVDHQIHRKQSFPVLKVETPTAPWPILRVLHQAANNRTETFSPNAGCPARRFYVWGFWKYGDRPAVSLVLLLAIKNDRKRSGLLPSFQKCEACSCDLRGAKRRHLRGPDSREGRFTLAGGSAFIPGWPTVCALVSCKRWVTLLRFCPIYSLPPIHYSLALSAANGRLEGG
jgi:hypothetical protein